MRDNVIAAYVYLISLRLRKRRLVARHAGVGGLQVVQDNGFLLSHDIQSAFKVHLASA